MSQQEQQFDKLWQVFDDAVKEGKYHYIKNHFMDDNNGRCALGLLMSYIDPEVDFHNIHVKATSLWRVIQKKFNFDLSPQYEYPESISDKDLVRKLKKDYQAGGKLDTEIMVTLNNRGYDFTMLRDIFKEIDA